MQGLVGRQTKQTSQWFMFLFLWLFVSCTSGPLTHLFLVFCRALCRECPPRTVSLLHTLSWPSWLWCRACAEKQTFLGAYTAAMSWQIKLLHFSQRKNPCPYFPTAGAHGRTLLIAVSNRNANLSPRFLLEQRSGWYDPKFHIPITIYKKI